MNKNMRRIKEGKFEGFTVAQIRQAERKIKLDALGDMILSKKFNKADIAKQKAIIAAYKRLKLFTRFSISNRLIKRLVNEYSKHER